MRFVVVTGMSGSGKTQALKMLEDMGYFCVDNLPLELIGKFAELAAAPAQEYSKVALGLDVRSLYKGRESVGRFLEIMKAYPHEILFLDCSQQQLVRRYKYTRRLHPLSQGGRIEDGIAAEVDDPEADLTFDDLPYLPDFESFCTVGYLLLYETHQGYTIVASRCYTDREEMMAVCYDLEWKPLWQLRGVEADRGKSAARRHRKGNGGERREQGYSAVIHRCNSYIIPFILHLALEVGVKDDNLEVVGRNG